MTCVDSPGMTAWNALVQLTADCRPKGASAWHEAGIKSAIRDLCASDRRFTFGQLVIVAITAATNAENRTPASIGFDASWTSAGPRTARVYSWDEGDPRYICGVCDMAEPACRQRAKTNGHEFLPRTKCLPPTDRTSGWMTRRPAKCQQGPPDAPCQLEVGHDGQHQPPIAPPPEPTTLDALTTRRPDLAEAADRIAALNPGLRVDDEAAAAAGEVTG